jgi:hypothetical protein
MNNLETAKVCLGDDLLQTPENAGALLGPKNRLDIKL